MGNFYQPQLVSLPDFWSINSSWLVVHIGGLLACWFQPFENLHKSNRIGSTVGLGEQIVWNHQLPSPPRFNIDLETKSDEVMCFF